MFHSVLLENSLLYNILEASRFSSVVYLFTYLFICLNCIYLFSCLIVIHCINFLNFVGRSLLD